jgi:hypothetical protein
MESALAILQRRELRIQPETTFHFKRDIVSIQEALSLVDLDESRKKILQLRVDGLLHEYKLRCRIYSITFHTLRTMTTVGSLIVPALLSAQYVNGSVTSQAATIGLQVYWSVWIISLFVTICNGLMNLMKIDKKYHVLHTCYQHLISEIWQYIQLSGKYSGSNMPGLEATHLSQYVYICNTLEKIRMKHIEEEYYKITEQNGPPSDSLVPPTPFKGISEEKEKSIVLVNDQEITLKKSSRGQP